MVIGVFAHAKHSTIKATGANLYENALNNAHRTIVKTFKY